MKIVIPAWEALPREGFYKKWGLLFPSWNHISSSPTLSVEFLKVVIKFGSKKVSYKIHFFLDAGSSFKLEKINTYIWLNLKNKRLTQYNPWGFVKIPISPQSFPIKFTHFFKTMDVITLFKLDREIGAPRIPTSHLIVFHTPPHLLLTFLHLHFTHHIVWTSFSPVLSLFISSPNSPLLLPYYYPAIYKGHFTRSVWMILV